MTKLEEMAQLAREGKKIEAIKIYREIYGVGLLEAKNAIEQLQATGRLDAPPTTASSGERVEMPGLTGARTFRLIVGVLIILMMVAIAVLGLVLFTGH